MENEIKIERLIMNFCGCDLILKASDPRYLDKAEKEVKRIFDKQFHIPTDLERKKIVERELGIKKHWLLGWIKTNK